MWNQEIAYSQIIIDGTREELGEFIDRSSNNMFSMETIDGTREELEEFIDRSSNNMFSMEIIDKCIHGTLVSEQICREI